MVVQDITTLKLFEIKFLNQPGLIWNEAQVLQMLGKHSNASSLVKLVPTPEIQAIITEYKPHWKRLSTLLQTGPLTEAQARLLFRQLLKIVGHAHNCNIAHRAIHPEHIIVSKNLKKLKLIGWESAELDCMITDSMFLPPHRAILESKALIGLELDLFALGGVLFSMVSGMNFFQDYSVEAASPRGTVLYKAMPLVKNVSPALMALINVLLSPKKIKQCTLSWLCSHRWLVAGVGRSKSNELVPARVEYESNHLVCSSSSDFTPIGRKPID